MKYHFLFYHLLFHEKKPFFVGLFNYFLLSIIILVFTASYPKAKNLDEIIVTGSHIPKESGKYAKDLIIFNANNLQKMGVEEFGDIINFLPSNSGSEFNSDVFTQNLSSGTSNFNLRGLGLNTTLVLLNGRRQTVSGAIADDGSSFVDINSLVPVNLVNRVEILKDGGSALYGSDAVAGVVNIITKKNIEGLQLNLRLDKTLDSSQEDINLNIAYGLSLDKLNIVSSITHLKRSWLSFAERNFSKDKGVSSFGQPGAFILLEESSVFPDLPFGEDSPKSIIDPDCERGGGVRREKVENTDQGLCAFNFSSFYHLIPKESRWLNYNSLIFESDNYEFFIEGGFANIDISRGTSPSFPILNLVTVPSNNPGNIFRTPALFLGRALGNESPENLVKHNSKTFRLSSGLTARFKNETGLNITLSYSKNKNSVKIKDILETKFNDALNGMGGPNGDKFFNPFGSAALVSPSDTRYNNQDLIDSFSSIAEYNYSPSLFLMEGLLYGSIVSNDLLKLDFAFGSQFRYEEIKGDHDENFNNENYLFLIGGPDFYGYRNIYSFFGELNFKIIDKLDFQLAIRNENHGKGLSSTDPKILINWYPNKWINPYISFSTSYRAPSIFQMFSSQTALQNIFDPLNSSSVFRSVRTLGTENLLSEEAQIKKLGVNINLFKELNFKIDYWDYNYKNLIVKESAQQIIDLNPFDQRILRRAGQILAIETNYINAPRIKTSGLDLGLHYNFNLDNGYTFEITGDLTYLKDYFIIEQQGAEMRDISGKRNFRNFARSLPKWRSFLGVNFANQFYGGSFNLKSISGYFDDQNNEDIEDVITFDTQLYIENLSLFNSDLDSYKLTIGILNIFNRLPPEINTTIGYDSKVHNPRGRVVYMALKSSF